MSSPLVQSLTKAAGATPRDNTYASSVTATNFVVIAVRFSLAATSIVVQLDGVNATEVLSNTGQAETGGTAVEHVYYWPNIAGGSGAVHVAWSGGGTARWKSSEFNSLDTTTPLITSARTSGATAASGTSPSVSTSPWANALILGCFTTSGAPTYTAGTQGPSGYTLDDANSLLGTQIEEQVLTSVTALTADMSWTGGALAWASYILALKYASQPSATSKIGDRTMISSYWWDENVENFDYANATNVFGPQAGILTQRPAQTTLVGASVAYLMLEAMNGAEEFFGARQAHPSHGGAAPPPVVSHRHPLYWIKKEGR